MVAVGRTWKSYPPFASFSKLILFFVSHLSFKSRLSLIVRVNVVLNRTVVVDSDWRFDNLCGSLWLWRWLPHRLSKRQSVSTTTVLFRTTFTRTIKLNLLKWLLGSNLSQFSFKFLSLKRPNTRSHAKLHTDDVTPPRYDWSWSVGNLLEPCKEMHYLGLGTDASSAVAP